jgi:acetylornithine deacetylase
VAVRFDDLELFRKLVSFDTTSSNSNLPIADFICEYLERDGVEMIRVPNADGKKANLVFWLGPPSNDGGGLLISGHTDVVPAREPGWESDPFTLVERDGSFFARGASDMKGSLALAMNAFASTSKAAKPLVLLFTYDEEVGTLGACDFVRQWPKSRQLPRNALIGEPTSLRVVSAHKGHLKLSVTVRGKSAHSAYPSLGRNAIERAGGVIAALTKLRMRLASNRSLHSDRFPDTPFATLNIGTIRGGSAVNVIPDRCELEVGIRLLPEMQSEEVISEVRDILSRVLAPGECQLDVLSDSPPMLSDAKRPIHRELCTLVTQTSLESVSFASDAGWLQQMGLDCVLFGPGSIEVAHRPNEFMPRDEFERARTLFPQIIRRFCE